MGLHLLVPKSKLESQSFVLPVLGSDPVLLCCFRGPSDCALHLTFCPHVLRTRYPWIQRSHPAVSTLLLAICTFLSRTCSPCGSFSSAVLSSGLKASPCLWSLDSPQLLSLQSPLAWPHSWKITKSQGCHAQRADCNTAVWYVAKLFKEVLWVLITRRTLFSFFFFLFFATYL